MNSTIAFINETSVEFEKEIKNSKEEIKSWGKRKQLSNKKI